jgi:hypothetical protein
MVLTRASIAQPFLLVFILHITISILNASRTGLLRYTAHTVHPPLRHSHTSVIAPHLNDAAPNCSHRQLGGTPLNDRRQSSSQGKRHLRPAYQRRRVHTPGGGLYSSPAQKIRAWRTSKSRATSHLSTTVLGRRGFSRLHRSKPCLNPTGFALRVASADCKVVAEIWRSRHLRREGVLEGPQR